MSSTSPTSGIVGHGATLALLGRVYGAGQGPHALLASGPRGVGKRRAVQQCAYMLLGVDSASKSGQRAIEAGSIPDLHVVSPQEGKRDIPVEKIRELREALRLKPYAAPCRVAIIDDADRMSAAACNALLMILEEPPPQTYLMLVSAASHRLPATILSRCFTVNFAYLTEPELLQVLEQLSGGTSPALRALLPVTDGTLAPLGLDRFIDPLGLQVRDRGELEAHLESLRGELTRIDRELQRLIESPGDTTRAMALSSLLSDDSTDQTLLWSVLRRFVEDRLRSATESQRGWWAELLSETLQAERLVQERNASMPLQLAGLFLRFCSPPDGPRPRL